MNKSDFLTQDENYSVSSFQIFRKIGVVTLEQTIFLSILFVLFMKVLTLVLTLVLAQPVCCAQFGENVFLSTLHLFWPEELHLCLICLPCGNRSCHLDSICSNALMCLQLFLV